MLIFVMDNLLNLVITFQIYIDNEDSKVLFDMPLSKLQYLDLSSVFIPVESKLSKKF